MGSTGREGSPGRLRNLLRAGGRARRSGRRNGSGCRLGPVRKLRRLDSAGRGALDGGSRGGRVSLDGRCRDREDDGSEPRGRAGSRSGSDVVLVSGEGNDLRLSMVEFELAGGDEGRTEGQQGESSSSCPFGPTLEGRTHPYTARNQTKSKKQRSATYAGKRPKRSLHREGGERTLTSPIFNDDPINPSEQRKRSV